MSGSDPSEAVLAEHDAMLRRIAAGYEHDPERRRELLQELRFAVWRALPRYRGDGVLRAFVARVAHNRALTHVAHEAAAPRSSELSEAMPATGPTPVEQAEREDLRRRLEHAAGALPLGLRQPAMLTLEGFTPAEIGEILGLNANAVSIRLTRAKAALRTALGETRSDA